MVLAALKVVTSADVLSAFYRQNIHSFIFVPVFCLGRVPGAAAPRRLELFHRQQRSQIVLRLSWLHTKTGQSNVGDATNPTGPSTSGPLSRGYSQQDLHRKSFVTFLVKWPNQCNRAFSIRMRHSGIYKFHSCALCRAVSRRELFTKIPKLPLALRIVFIQSLVKIYDRRRGQEQGVLTAAHCSIHCLGLLEKHVASFFYCWYSFRPGLTQTKTHGKHVEGPAEKMLAVPNLLLKANVDAVA